LEKDSVMGWFTKSPEPVDEGLDPAELRGNLIAVIEHLPPAAQLAAAVDLCALIFAGAGIREDHALVQTFPDMVAGLLPGRIETTREELAAVGYEFPGAGMV
jgi:hypothetical protein